VFVAVVPQEVEQDPDGHDCHSGVVGGHVNREAGVVLPLALAQLLLAAAVVGLDGLDHGLQPAHLAHTLLNHQTQTFYTLGPLI